MQLARQKRQDKTIDTCPSFNHYPSFNHKGFRNQRRRASLLQLLGRCVKDLPREEIYVATKVGKYKPGEEEDFSAERVTKSVHESLQRLELEYIDLIHCHDVESAKDMKQVGAMDWLLTAHFGSKDPPVRTVKAGLIVGCVADCRGDYSCPPEAEGTRVGEGDWNYRPATGHLPLCAGQVGNCFLAFVIAFAHSQVRERVHFHSLPEALYHISRVLAAFYRVPDGTVDAVLSYCHNNLADNTITELVPYLQKKGVAVISASFSSMGLLTQKVCYSRHPCTALALVICD